MWCVGAQPFLPLRENTFEVCMKNNLNDDDTLFNVRITPTATLEIGKKLKDFTDNKIFEVPHNNLQALDVALLQVC
jgi:hypothetical protein